MRQIGIALLVPVVIAGGVAAQGAWRDRTPMPTAQHRFAAAFDTARGTLVMFGASLPSGPSQAEGTSTWERDAAGWRRRPFAGEPGPRLGHRLVFDAVRREVVMFGGATGVVSQATPINETWGFDGTSWRLRASGAGAPPPRRDTALAFDSARARVVAFGGSNGSELNDQWEWDGAAWSQVPLTVRPSARASHAMAYDQARGRLVLFGGFAAVELGDTWEWNGAVWSPIVTATSPSPRLRHVMAYDPVRQRTILFGGTTQTGQPLSDTWEWTGAQWSQRAVTTQGEITNLAGLVFDSTAGTCAVVGAVRGTDATRSWYDNGVRWGPAVPPPDPPGRRDQAMAYDLDRDRVVMFGGLLDGTSQLDGTTWEWDGIGWQHILTGTRPPARSLAAMASDLHGKLVMFGGFSSPMTAQTWLYNGVDWLLHSGLAPSPRHQAAMATDWVRGGIVLFGGEADPLTRFGDTWYWNGSGWQLRQPVHAPSPRSGAAMTFDFPSGSVLLYGGSDRTGIPLDDTWTWDGSDWRERLPTHRPSAFGGGVLVTDPVGLSPLLFDSNLTNSWSWDGADWSPRAATPDLGRSHFAVANDLTRGRLVLFGGERVLTQGDFPSAPLLHVVYSASLWEYGTVSASVGSGCAGSAGVPDLQVEGPVRLGGSLALVVRNLAATAGLAIVGYGDASALSPLGRLPVDLGAIGLPGCQLHTSLQATGVGLANAGVARFAESVPLRSALLGLSLRAQALGPDAGWNAGNAVVSNAVEIVVEQ